MTTRRSSSNLFNAAVLGLLALISLLQFLLLKELRSTTTFSDLTATADRESLQELVADLPLVRIYGTVEVGGRVDIDNIVDVQGVVEVPGTVSVEVENEPLGVIVY